MRRQLVQAKIIVTNQQTKMHKLTVITEPTTRKNSKLLNERRLNNYIYIWMNQLNKANAKRSTSLKNIKDRLSGRFRLRVFSSAEDQNHRRTWKSMVSHWAAHKLTLQFAMSAKALPSPSLRPPPHNEKKTLFIHARPPIVCSWTSLNAQPPTRLRTLLKV